MINYIIIIYTRISLYLDLEKIAKSISNFESINEWSVDYEDCDKVLRILTSHDESDKIVDNLKSNGIQAELMAVYLANSAI